ncbi:MAG: 4-hydroxy-tetrahydrodipicolinate synthase [Deltaproteobacteria bacterium]|nr:4-hydroxy-tetrahydrodipicolinate synthase [Deltaproteobacteria bacterium]MBW2140594.1 4-hydroxy-tetrahydrodipicolinate synthase [Deltaproteobacteria bacterium]
MFSGAMVAIVTPFSNGQVDEEAFRRLINFQIDNGTHAIVPCGTTGESATLSHEEHNHVVEFAIKEVNGRVPVIAGTGSNSTAEAIALTRHAKEAGADGALMILPYYNKPTQEGLYQHFKAVTEAVSLPIIMYNIPSRTGINMLPDTVARLSKLENIIGVKESSGDLIQMTRIFEQCGDDFDLISGDDPLTLPLMAVGGKGVISVASNVVPREVSDMVTAFQEGNLSKSREIFIRLQPLFRALFLETNPIPVKMALGFMGMIDPEMRLPLYPMSEENTNKLKKVLADYGLIK